MPKIDIKEIRKKCWNDLYLFNKIVLGYQDIAFYPHNEMCSFVQNWGQKDSKLILTPRGSFKTSCVTIGYSLFEIWHNPDIRVLIMSEERAMARKILREIKGKAESEFFKIVCGDWVGDTGWTEDEITVATRKKALKEPTITIAGIDSSTQGPKYDLIICDDIVGQNNTQTTAQIQKVIDNFLLIEPLKEAKGSRLIVIGTRWNYSDVYGYILENLRDQYDILIRGAYNKDGTLYFPSILTREFLQKKKKTMTTMQFSCQYLNDPVPEDTAIFRKSYFKYWRPQDLPNNLRVYMTVDPASTVSKESDFSAIVVTGVDMAMNIYVLYLFQDKLVPSKLADKIVEVYKQFKPKKLGVETAGAKFLLPVLREVFQRQAIFPNIIELKHAGYGAGSKEDRIQELEPRFREGKIYLPKDSKHLKELEMQLLKFPRYRGHDDLADALASQLEIIDFFDEEGDEERPIYTFRPANVVAGY